MREVYTEIEIDAPEEIVWAVLTDFNRYPEWNPFIVSIAGNLQIGNKLKIKIKQPDKETITFRPKCLKLSVNREISWLGHFIIPGLIDGEHTFQLFTVSNGTTRFVQKVAFKGILLPFFWVRIRTQTTIGFKEMNFKLKEVAENQLNLNNSYR